MIIPRGKNIGRNTEFAVRESSKINVMDMHFKNYEAPNALDSCVAIQGICKCPMQTWCIWEDAKPKKF